MSSDIEEFLRRAAARRQQRQAQAQRPAGPQAARTPPDIEIIEPVEAQVVDAQPVHEGISQQVEQYFGSGNLVAGDEVDQADEQMRDHLQQVFDHRLGQLSDTTVQAQGVQIELAEPQAPRVAPSAPSRAGEIARMMASPRGMREAIVLSEILKRPEDRWQ